MGASKRYKGKECAYCGEPGSTSTNDHVVARSFFLDEDRTAALPKVAACWRCNNEKSALENYVVSSVLIGSKHPEAARYRSEKIASRFEKNQRLRRELNIDSPVRWELLNGVWQKLHTVQIDAGKITRLLEMIVRGLYRHHYGKPLPREMEPDVKMFPPEHEAAMWAGVSDYFPPDAPRIRESLGRGTFTYETVQSPANEGFTAWVMAMHGNIPLYGADGSADHWWGFTRPTSEAVQAALSA